MPVRALKSCMKWFGTSEPQVSVRMGSPPVTLVGINFSSRKRNIDIPVIEAL